MRTQNSKPGSCFACTRWVATGTGAKRAQNGVPLRTQNYQDGSVLVLTVISMVLLLAVGVGMLAVAYDVRLRAIKLKNEAVAMLAAEAGYENAIFWMSQQQDMLSALQKGVSGTEGTLYFAGGSCDYQIGLFTFVQARPIYRVLSNGHSGVFNRTVDVLVVQAIPGWAMGMCRVASGKYKTYPVNFANGEIIDMPIHINELGDNPDNRDIYIIGDPQFLEPVAMGESRYRDGSGSDKYSGMIGLFDDGIYFDQPDCKITDEAAVQSKVDRFRDSTDVQFRFTPVGDAPTANSHAAVQLEFFVEGGEGKVRITNNCTVRGYRQSLDSRTWDFRIRPGSGGSGYERYDIYTYHLRDKDADENGERFTRLVDESYVTQSISGEKSEPGGQIFVDGDVIIGSGDPLLPGQDRVKGKITVVATGNIWIGDSTVLDGTHDANDMPSMDNPNVLGLIAQGMVKVVDPGMTDPSVGSVGFKPVEPGVHEYVPIGRPDNPLTEKGDADYHLRHLPD